MKKYYFIIGIAAAMFAACSSSEEGLSQDGANPIDEENLTREDLMGDIPIEIGISNFGATVDVEEQTRGSIPDDFTTGTMGVYCLSAGKILSGASDDDVLRSWSGGVGAYLNMLNIWQDNVKAHVQNVSLNTGKMTWDDRDARHYYPAKDYFKYGFVAYHPYTKAIQRSKSAIFAYVTIDGDDDVIHAVADAPAASVNTETDALSYSNEYFKRVQANGGITDEHKPYFRFKHLTAKLKFTVKLKSASERQLYVDSICFSDFINTMKLGIAKFDNGVVGGVNEFPVISNITSVPDSLRDRVPAVRGHFWLREQNGSSLRDHKAQYALNTTDKKPVGDCIMIPPLPASVSSANINLEVYLRDEDGNLFTTLSPMTVNVPADGWQMGKEYTINISITPPSFLIDDTRGAVLNDWSVETTQIDVTDND